MVSLMRCPVQQQVQQTLRRLWDQAQAAGGARASSSKRSSTTCPATALQLQHGGVGVGGCGRVGGCGWVSGWVWVWVMMSYCCL
jgi:hypothetical protein